MRRSDVNETILSSYSMLHPQKLVRLLDLPCHRIISSLHLNPVSGSTEYSMNLQISSRLRAHPVEINKKLGIPVVDHREFGKLL